MTGAVVEMRNWCDGLISYCSPQQPVDKRLACSGILLANADTLLIDHTRVLGDSVASCWCCLMLLMQDEDEDVRRQATTCIQPLRHHLPVHLTEQCVDDVETSLALDLCLEVLVEVHRGNSLLTLLRTLIRWVEEDLQPAWPHEDKEVRLFGKGEINPYQDELRFASLVAKHLKQLLGDMGTTTKSDDDSSWQKLVTRKLSEVLHGLEENWRALCVTSQGAGVWLQQAEFRERSVMTGRQVILLEALISDDVMDTEEDEVVFRCISLIREIKGQLQWDILS